MKDFSISIDSDFIKTIPKLSKDIDKLAASALRKTARQTEVEIHRLITSNNLIDISFNDFIRKTDTRGVTKRSELKSGIENMNIKIKITGRPYTSYRFAPSYMVLAKRKVWVGRIYGKVKRFYGGKAFAVPGKKPLFARNGRWGFSEKKQRIAEKISPVYGPNVPDMMAKTGLLPKLYDFTGMNLRVNLSKSFKDSLDI